MDCEGLGHMALLGSLGISTISHWEHVEHIVNKMEGKALIITIITSEVEMGTFLDIKYVVLRSVMQ